MGDFNINLDTYSDKRTKGSSLSHDKYSIMNVLFKKHFTDIQDKFEPKPLTFTWNNKSRIDGIFVNQTMVPNIIHAMIDTNATCYTSDHRAVIMKVDRLMIEKISPDHEARLKNKRTIYNYHKMDTTKWKNFKTNTKLEILNSAALINFKVPTLIDIHILNFYNGEL